MKRFFHGVAPFTAIMALLLVESYAGTLTNGSFELPGGLAPDSFVVLPSDDNRLVGWTIAGPNPNSEVALHNGLSLPELDFLPVHGEYHLAFNGGNRPAGALIAQTFDTIPGIDYEVTFHVGRLGSGAGEVSLEASVTSATGQGLATLTAIPPAHGYGDRQQLIFVATTDRTTLFFTDTSEETDSVDISLDNIEVSPLAPELSIQVTQIEVCWDSLDGRLYQVQFRSELTTNLWMDLGEAIQGSGGPLCIADPVEAGPRRFYRVLKLP